MDDLKNGLVFFDHLKKKMRELYRLRLMHERYGRLFFLVVCFLIGINFFRISFLSWPWCFMLVILTYSFVS